jgi:hypothetical protein
MGMLTRILSLKAKRLFRIEEPPKEVLPLGLRLNAIVRLDPTVFILGGSQLKVECPEGDNIVYAIGKFPFSDYIVRRFYLKNLRDEESMLQITTCKDETVEVMLYRTFAEIVPQTSEEWGAWLDEQNGHIGAQKINSPDGLEYFRTYGESLRFNPFSFIEKVSCPEGNFDIDHYAMFYSREVENSGQKIGEYLLVSKEETGDEAEEAMIRISTGVEVNPQSLTILSDRQNNRQG